MTCDEAEILLHALIDGELDAGHAREVEAHLATLRQVRRCCRDYREIRKAMAAGGLRYTAPPELRRRIEASLPQAKSPTRRACCRDLPSARPSRRSPPAGLFAVILRGDDERACRPSSSRRICARCRPII